MSPIHHSTLITHHSIRVAHVITRLIVGGAQENTVLTCQDLMARHGDEVLLVAGPGLGPEGSLEEEARRRGVPLAILPSLRREIHPWRDVVAYRALRGVLRDFAPQVVHTHSGKGGLLGRRAAWGLRVPAIVHTVHGAPFHAYQGRGARAFFRACERYATARCHAMVSVADAMTDQLVAAGVAPREKFTTIYSGMEVEPFLQAERHRQEMRQRLGYAPGDLVVGKVARLFHLKGHRDVIEAIARARARFPQLRLLLVGDGLLRRDLEQQIARAGLGEVCRFTGLVAPDEIPRYLAATDLVVHASLREGLARVLPQALLVGRPVVSYDIDGAREVVVPGETGYLVPPGDATGIASAIEALAADAELRERLAGAGRARCRDLFRHEERTADIRTLYERLLERTTTAS